MNKQYPVRMEFKLFGDIEITARNAVEALEKAQEALFDYLTNAENATGLMATFEEINIGEGYIPDEMEE